MTAKQGMERWRKFLRGRKNKRYDMITITPSSRPVTLNVIMEWEKFVKKET